MKFSKGASLFLHHALRLKTENVGGIIPGAVVLMAGVPVGDVLSTELDPSGKSVTVRVKILQRYRIHGDAVFTIKQMGFLGDRFISVVPGANEKPFLNDGDEVYCEEPFDLQEVARSAAGLLKRVDQTAQKLNEAVARLDRSLLAEESLSNLTATVGNFRLVSERALTTVANIDQFVATNRPVLRTSVTNLAVFSDQLTRVAAQLEEAVVTNKVEFTLAVKNIESATVQINQLLTRLQEGKGLAGSFLKNEELSQNVSLMVSNLTVLSSNMNKLGLLAVLRAPKPPKTNTVQRPLHLLNIRFVKKLCRCGSSAFSFSSCTLSGYAVSQVQPGLIERGSYGGHRLWHGRASDCHR